MANQPKKLTDPTDEAMTAIQQVLSATDEPMDTRGPTVRPHTPREPAPHSSYASEPSPEKDLFEGPAHLTSDDARPGQLAANDDRLSIGQILHSLQQRPSNGSYVIATVFAVAWAACGVALAFLYLPGLQAVLKPRYAGSQP